MVSSYVQAVFTPLIHLLLSLHLPLLPSTSLGKSFSLTYLHSFNLPKPLQDCYFLSLSQVSPDFFIPHSISPFYATHALLKHDIFATSTLFFIIFSNNQIIYESNFFYIFLYIQEFLAREHVEKDVMDIIEENYWNILVIMGLTINESDVRRDIAILSCQYRYRENVSFSAFVDYKYAICAPKSLPFQYFLGLENFNLKTYRNKGS